jgi:Leucine-rich repeat (LRR) protein
MDSLKEIVLMSNKLSSFPSSITNLHSLSNIDASGNQIAILPNDFGNLASLQIINLSMNSLESLPNSIGILSNLRALLINNNRLSQLPSSIINLRLDSLQQSLWLDSNYICNSSEDITKWANTYEPNWRKSQRCNSNSKRVNIITISNSKRDKLGSYYLINGRRSISRNRTELTDQNKVGRVLRR